MVKVEIIGAPVYRIELDVETATVLKALVGNVIGGGPTRDRASEIYYAMDDAGVPDTGNLFKSYVKTVE